MTRKAKQQDQPSSAPKEATYRKWKTKKSPKTPEFIVSSGDEDDITDKQILQTQTSAESSTAKKTRRDTKKEPLLLYREICNLRMLLHPHKRQ